MLICSESFYELEIKGKSETEIRSKIRSLKRQIGLMKNHLENPNFKKEILKDPSDNVMIFYYREYLNRSIIALKDLGFEYNLSRNEIRAKLFQDNIPYIEKITFHIGGYFDLGTTKEITFNDNKVVFIEKMFDKIVADKLHNDVNKGDFIDALKRLYIGEWRKSYNTRRFNYFVLDGTQWYLTIEYSNGTKPFKLYGSNSYPYNFQNWRELIYI